MDRYGRTVARLETSDGKDCEAVMIASGYAWHDVQYAKGAKHYTELQNKAEREKRGLWIGPDPMAPWDWRKKPKE